MLKDLSVEEALELVSRYRILFYKWWQLPGGGSHRKDACGKI